VVINGDGFKSRDDPTLSNGHWDVKFGVLKRFVGENLSLRVRLQRRSAVCTRKAVGGKRNASDNFSVEIVFYEREYKLNCDGQAGDIGGTAATRELFADTFRRFHDAVDGGVSFLLFVDAVGSWRGSDVASSAFSKSAGLKRFTTEFAEGTEADEGGCRLGSL
jgi:hypothetical protein